MIVVLLRKKENSMSQTNGNGRPNGGAREKFEPEIVWRYLKHSASRLMRANELMMRGMMNMAKRQMELGQELMQHRMSALRGQDGEKPAGYVRVQAQQNLGSVKRVIAGLHDVTEDLTNCFNQATQSLFEDADEVAAAADKTAGAAVRMAGTASENLTT
jgi:hypothetical protein